MAPYDVASDIHQALPPQADAAAMRAKRFLFATRET
jgi:hypothetical protein